MYRQTTRALTVSVEPEFLERESDPDRRHYVWAYHVRIENHGGETVQLVRRYWRIVDISIPAFSLDCPEQMSRLN